MAAEFRYQRGGEAVQAGGLTGTASFKVRVRSSTLTRALTVEAKMRDVRRGREYQVREVDAITHRSCVWLVVEHGVAL